MYTIYHNSRCSKSRQTLALLEEQCALKNQKFKIVEYLKAPLTNNEINQLLQELSCKPIEMMRVKETEFTEMNLKGTDDKTLIDAMVTTPKLIERPIVTNGTMAIIGRPPENVLTFFAE